MLKFEEHCDVLFTRKKLFSPTIPEKINETNQAQIQMTKSLSYLFLHNFTSYGQSLLSEKEAVQFDQWVSELDCALASASNEEIGSTFIYLIYLSFLSGLATRETTNNEVGYT